MCLAHELLHVVAHSFAVVFQPVFQLFVGQEQLKQLLVELLGDFFLEVVVIYAGVIVGVLYLFGQLVQVIDHVEVFLRQLALSQLMEVVYKEAEFAAGTLKLYLLGLQLIILHRD